VVFIDSPFIKLDLVPIDAALARAHERGAVFDAGDQTKGSHVHDLSPFRHSIQECPTVGPSSRNCLQWSAARTVWLGLARPFLILADATRRQWALRDLLGPSGFELLR
jgi:hypothetical protein